MEEDGIAVIGLAGRFPRASNPEELWRNLCDGVESLTTFSDDELLQNGEDPVLVRDPAYVKSGMLLENADWFDAPFFGFTPREAENTDPQHRVFLECAWEALEDAGYDPERYAGKVGVFAGAGLHCGYHDLVMRSRLRNGSGLDLQTFIGIEKDFLSTRVSYKLNLRGPSLSLQTGCSTSLVCVHMACQSLLNGESDIALAGGVSIRIPQVAGYLHREGSIVSPDGHCRAFDAHAQGTAFGSGAGVVVLKRLADALADGDHIRAIIAGSSINNDGAMKVGYTAPTIDGQAAVIAEAQAIAGVSADEVNYIEAHGTGTTLGDPIEVAALTKAFRRTTRRNGFCAIGSLKTNIGHLDAASGVAGLIKVVLALEHRKLPASLNFAGPNPAIDFANSPFYVQRELADWTALNGPRVAGVSSFGIGGTNAHVVLREAPRDGTPADPPRWNILPISARTPEALDRAAIRLAEWLKSHSGLSLADVAATLQEGRKHFPYRRAVAAHGVNDALAQLAAGSKRVHSGKIFDASPGVVFLFPAQGSQHVNMGRGLYENEPVFRETVDRCAALLRPRLGIDLRTLLYPPDAEAEAASEQLRQTAITQPAVFTIDYAMARLWMSWGLVPAAVAGHSLGEYVAAAIAGIFELEDALQLVSERARLMQDLPGGVMLSVQLPESDLRRYLSNDVSVAAVNAPNLTVASGPAAAIQRLAGVLRGEHIEFQTLRTSHAFHSGMMDPVIAPLTERVSAIRRNAPRIPLVSTRTGTWMTASEATDPRYWGRHTRDAVRFSAAIQELLKTPGRLLLECGPGNTLTALARLHLKGGTDCAAVNSLPHAQEQRSDQDCVLSALGTLWIAGVAPDWKALRNGSKPRRVPLPTYPFERRRYSIEERPDGSPTRTALPEDECRRERGSTHTAGHLSSEQKLARIWQDALGVANIGVDDNFFDLGGQSLLAVSILGEIERIFHKRIPMASLIQAPTIRELAPLLREHSAPDQWSALVPLSTGGSGRPLFLMHSHGGNILEYQPLARRLGNERPIYALQARGLDGRTIEQPHIEEMASCYLEEIRSVQPHGPYHLAGFCFGGFLALEAARQLRAENEEADLVILINTATRAYPVYSAMATPAHRLLYRMWYRGALEWSGLSARPWDERLPHIAGRVKRMADVLRPRAAMMLEKLGWPSHTGRHSIAFRLEYLARMHDRAWLAYEPKPYDGCVLLLRARRQPLGICPDPMLGWGGLLTGTLETRDVPGFRQTMLDEPHVDELAGVVGGALKACEAGRLINA